MPEIKNTFLSGKMNKDLDERLIPKGEYRDALNLDLSTSESDDVGSLQNAYGNTIQSTISTNINNPKCVGSVTDKENDKIYWFIAGDKSELLTNGELTGSSAKGWTGAAVNGVLDTGWTAGAGNVAASSAATSTKFIHDGDITFTVGRRYTLTYTIRGYSAGGLKALIVDADGDNATFTTRSANGTYTETVQLTNNVNLSANFNKLYFEPTATFTGTIESISLIEEAVDAIMEYDFATGAETKVLIDAREYDSRVLKFDQDNLITGINILDGLLFWTDGVNEPKKINIKSCIQGSAALTDFTTTTQLNINGSNTGLIQEKDITVIKKYPRSAPKMSLSKDSKRKRAVTSTSCTVPVNTTYTSNSHLWEASSGKSYQNLQGWLYGFLKQNARYSVNYNNTSNSNDERVYLQLDPEGGQFTASSSNPFTRLIDSSFQVGKAGQWNPAPKDGIALDLVDSTVNDFNKISYSFWNGLKQENHVWGLNITDTDAIDGDYSVKVDKITDRIYFDNSLVTKLADTTHDNYWKEDHRISLGQNYAYNNQSFWTYINSESQEVLKPPGTNSDPIILSDGKLLKDDPTSFMSSADQLAYAVLNVTTPGVNPATNLGTGWTGSGLTYTGASNGSSASTTDRIINVVADGLQAGKKYDVRAKFVVTRASGSTTQSDCGWVDYNGIPSSNTSYDHLGTEGWRLADADGTGTYILGGVVTATQSGVAGVLKIFKKDYVAVTVSNIQVTPFDSNEVRIQPLVFSPKPDYAVGDIIEMTNITKDAEGKDIKIRVELIEEIDKDFGNSFAETWTNAHVAGSDIVNDTFTGNADDFTMSAGQIAYSSNTVVKTAGANVTMLYDGSTSGAITITEGNYYQVEYTISSSNNSTWETTKRMYLYEMAKEDGTGNNHHVLLDPSDGTHKYSFKAGSTGLFKIGFDNALTLTLDNLKLRPITQTTQAVGAYGETDDKRIFNAKIKTISPKVLSVLTAQQRRFWDCEILNRESFYQLLFPRFAYRWKYADGEYSAISAFTEAAFLPGDGFKYDNEECYNLTMVNTVNRVQLNDFEHIPKDVVELDILYKESNSTVVYVLRTLKDIDTFVTTDSGKIEITKNQIKAAIESNQMLRHYDHVPKKAKSQEITANRLVYGNYTHQYDVNVSEESIPSLANIVSNAVPIDTSAKSIKSGRNYQIGAAWLDDYGRQTTVFTDKNCLLDLDWDAAQNSNHFTAKITNTPPDWATHYKYYIKDSAGEYYNLALDRHYKSEEDDNHVWLSFASKDRNKVTIDDYLILKKTHDINLAADTTFGSREGKYRSLRYKIIDIENEAPEHIKTRRTNIGGKIQNVNDLNGTAASVATFATPTGLHFFTQTSYGGAATYWPKKEKSLFRVRGDVIANEPALEEALLDSQLDRWIRFGKVESSATLTYSNYYELSSVRRTAGSTGSFDTPDAHYEFTLSKPIGGDGSFLGAEPTSGATSALDDAVEDRNIFFEYYKQEVDQYGAEWEGRFFVKIVLDESLQKEIAAKSVTEENAFKVVQSEDTHWIQVYDTKIKNYHSGTANHVRPSYIEEYDNTNHPGGTDKDITLLKKQWFKWSTMQGNWDGGSGDVYTSSAGDGRYVGDGTVTTFTTPAVGVDGSSSGARFQGYFGQNSSSGTGTTWDGPFNNKWANPINGDTWDYIPMTEYRQDFDPSWAGNSVDQNVNPDFPGWVHYYYAGSNQYSSGVGSQSLKKITTNVANTDANGDNTPTTHLFQSTFATNNNTTTGGASGVQDITNHQSRHPILNPYINYWEGTHTSEDYKATNSPQLFCIDQAWAWDAPANVLGYDPAKDNTNLGLGWVKGNNHCSFRIINIGDDENASGLKDDDYNTFISSGQPNSSSLSGAAANVVPDFSKLTGDRNNLRIKLTTPGTKFRWTDDPTNAGMGTIYTVVNAEEFFVRNYKSDYATWSFTVGNAEKGRNSAYQREPRRENMGWRMVIELDKPIMWSPTDATYVIDEAGTTQTALVKVKKGAANSGQGTNSTLEILEEEIGETTVASGSPAVFEVEPRDRTDLNLFYETSTTRMILKNGMKIEALNNININDSGYGPNTDFTQGGLNLPGNYEGPDDVGTTYAPSGVGTPAVVADSTILIDSSHDTDQFTIPGSALNTTLPIGVTIRITSLDKNGNNEYYRDFLLPTVASASVDTIVTLPTDKIKWHNCWSFGNGVESDRVRDDYNAVMLDKGPRVSTTLDEPYAEEHRKSGLIYSGIYNSQSGTNRLNQFIMAEKITKSLNPEYGSIQKLFTRNYDLLAFCEDKVLRILASKDALFNADGNMQLTATNKVLGQAVPFAGEFGISKNPESFADYGYRVYFSDKNRGTVLRLSQDGLTPISNYGMSNYFKTKFAKADTVLGSYDEDKDIYNITLDNSTISFTEKVNGWTSFKSFLPESGVSVNGVYYTFKNGDIWKHNVNDIRNNFYSTQYDSSVKFIFNDQPDIIKSFNTLNYEGTQSREYETKAGEEDQIIKKGWYTSSVESDKQSGQVPQFKEKEGKWYNNIVGVDSDETNIDTSEFTSQGLGIVTSVGRGDYDDYKTLTITATYPQSAPTVNLIGAKSASGTNGVLGSSSDPSVLDNGTAAYTEDSDYDSVTGWEIQSATQARWQGVPSTTNALGNTVNNYLLSEWVTGLVPGNRYFVSADLTNVKVDNLVSGSPSVEIDSTNMTNFDLSTMALYTGSNPLTTGIEGKISTFFTYSPNYSFPGNTGIYINKHNDTSGTISNLSVVNVTNQLDNVKFTVNTSATDRTSTDTTITAQKVEGGVFNQPITFYIHSQTVRGVKYGLTAAHFSVASPSNKITNTAFADLGTAGYYDNIVKFTAQAQFTSADAFPTENVDLFIQITANAGAPAIAIDQ